LFIYLGLYIFDIVSKMFDLGLGTHLFVKVPRPGDSEWPFSLRVKLPPVTTSLTTQS